MTDQAAPTPAPGPTGLKAKAGELVGKAYLKAPPKAQTVLLNGYLKAQPLVDKARPHAKRVLMGAGSVLVLRTVRRRNHRAP